jgi:hypothetical protein
MFSFVEGFRKPGIAIGQCAREQAHNTPNVFPVPLVFFVAESQSEKMRTGIPFGCESTLQRMF